MAYHDSHGSTTRVGSSSSIAHAEDARARLPQGDGPGAGLCHTMTTLDNGKALLVGGRASLGKPLKEPGCWIRGGGSNWMISHLPDIAMSPLPLTIVLSSAIEMKKALPLIFSCYGLKRGVDAEFVLTTKVPLARHSAALCWTDCSFGVFGGGWGAKGDVLEDMWRVELHEGPKSGDR